MTIYIVRAKPKKNLMEDLHKRLESGQISQLKPFGKALYYGLQNTKNIKITMHMHIGRRRLLLSTPFYEKKSSIISIFLGDKSRKIRSTSKEDGKE
jgi:formamidopyrimidine-DNA glycosylase